MNEHFEQPSGMIIVYSKCQAGFQTSYATDNSDPQPENMDSTPAQIRTGMYFMVDDPLYKTVKPYTMRYQPDDGLAQSNVKKDKYDVVVRSMREKLGDFHLDECGFECVEMKSNMAYEDWGDRGLVDNVYLEEVRTLLKRSLGAKHVHVLDYAVSVPGRILFPWEFM